jgi:hypothetical protein
MRPQGEEWWQKESFAPMLCVGGMAAMALGYFWGTGVSFMERPDALALAAYYACFYGGALAALVGFVMQVVLHIQDARNDR